MRENSDPGALVPLCPGTKFEEPPPPGPPDCSAGDSSSAAETPSTAQVAAVELAVEALLCTLPAHVARATLARLAGRMAVE